MATSLHDKVSVFQKMIDVNAPIVYIVDHDYVRVDYLLSKAVNVKNIKEWTYVGGTVDFRWKREVGNGGGMSLVEFLREQNNVGMFDARERPAQKTFLVLKGVHRELDDVSVVSLLLHMAQRKLYDPSFETTVIIVSPVQMVPVELEKYVSYFEIPFPNEADINMLIDEHIEINGYVPGKFTDNDRKKLMPSLKGMTEFEIDRMLDMAMSRDGSLSADDTQMILSQKKQMVKQSGVLELVDSPTDLNSIGGMDELKTYLKSKEAVMKNIARAQDFGVAVPKGVFIVGMPGCGKSLCAKATSALFNCPLLKLDMGSLMGKYQGESEGNLRKAIKTAEAAAPCVLWIDEIEKGFSGVGGENSESLNRMFGYFLSWMQDKTSSVYVIATANNANSLPPELKRKGRFDEIFCVNLPNKDERKSIFEVHIRKRKKNGVVRKLEVTSALLSATYGFNGADIESVVNEAIEKCFLDKERELKEQDLIDVAKNTISISKSCKTQILDMENVFRECSFRNASKA